MLRSVTGGDRDAVHRAYVLGALDAQVEDDQVEDDAPEPPAPACRWAPVALAAAALLAFALGALAGAALGTPHVAKVEHQPVIEVPAPVEREASCSRREPERVPPDPRPLPTATLPEFDIQHDLSVIEPPRLRD